MQGRITVKGDIRREQSHLNEPFEFNAVLLWIWPVCLLSIVLLPIFDILKLFVQIMNLRVRNIHFSS